MPEMVYCKKILNYYLATGKFCMLFCHLIFFKVIFFKNIPSGITKYQTVWIQIRPDILQTVCKGYQQTSLVGTELKLISLLVSFMLLN